MKKLPEQFLRESLESVELNLYASNDFSEGSPKSFSSSEETMNNNNNNNNSLSSSNFNKNKYNTSNLFEKNELIKDWPQIVEDLNEESKLNRKKVEKKLQSMQKQREYLMVGDILSLFSEKASGFLSAKGFFDTSCKIEPVAFMDETPSDFRNCLFTVKSIIDENRLSADEDKKSSRKPGQNTSIAQIVVCYACLNHCMEFFYHCDQEPSFNLCSRCFKEENFPFKITQSDFEKKVISKSKSSAERRDGDFVYYGQTIQLQHLSSEKFLSIRGASDVEPIKQTHKFFVGEDSEDSWFTILPRYKVHVHGDSVEYEDEIILLNVKWQTIQGLDISTIKEPKTGWRLFPFSKYNSIDNANEQICGGGLIRLFNMELESFLTSEPQNMQREVLLRATKKGTKHKDSNSLWQIIFDKPFYGGDSLLWNAPFRLQHAATSLYLAVRLKSNNHYAITLTDKVDSTTLFSFSPLKTDSPNVSNLSKLHLYSIEANCWLHAMSMPVNYRSSSIYHKTNYYQLSFQQNRLIQDTFVLVPAFYTEMVNLLHIKEANSILQSYLDQIESDRFVSIKLSASVTVVLKKLLSFTILSVNRNPYSAEGKPIRIRQALFRSQNTIGLFVQILKVPYEKKLENKIPGYSDHCKLIYRLLSHIVKDYPKNSNVLFEYLSFFKEQLEHFYNNVDLCYEIMGILGKLYENNHYLLLENKESTFNLIETALDIALKSISSHSSISFIQFLSILCVCGEESIPENQQYICDLLFNKYSKILLPTKLENNIVYILAENEWKDLTHLPTKSSNFILHRSIIHLFSQICKKRNYHCISKVIEVLPYQQVFHCVTDKTLPETLRASYCYLLISAFLDTKPQHPISLVHYSRFWNDLAGLGFTNTEEASNPYDPSWSNLKTFVKNYLESSLQGNSELTLAIITLCRYLVSFGLLDETESNEFFSLLYHLLDHEKESDQYLIDAKIKLCEIIDMLHDRHLDFCATKFLESFKEMYEKHKRVYLSNKNIQDIGKAVFGTHGKAESNLFDTQKSNILLLTKYAHNQLNSAAFRLLLRFFCPKEELNRFLSKTHLFVSDESVQLYEKTRKALHDIKKALASNIKGSNERRKRIESLLIELADLCIDASGRVNIRHQALLFYFEIHKSVIKLLKVCNAEKVKDSSFNTIAKACYYFLKKFVTKNSTNQEVLWSHFDLFVSDKQQLQDAISLLLEIVHDNVIICSSLTQNHVQIFMKLIAKHGNNSSILKLLRHFILKINRKPLFYNQILILKLMMAYKSQLFSFLISEEKQRKEAITNSFKNKDNILEYNVELLNLLSACCEDNGEAQTLCRELFSLTELVTYIEPITPITFKHGVLQLITYLYVESTTLKSDEPSFPEACALSLLSCALLDLKDLQTSKVSLEHGKYIFRSILPFLQSFFLNQMELIKIILSQDIKLKNDLIWEILEALLFIYQRQKNFKLSEKQTMTLFKCLQSMIPVAQLFVENLNLNQELEEISKKELLDVFEQAVTTGENPRSNIAATLTDLYDAMDEFRKTNKFNTFVIQRKKTAVQSNSELTISESLTKFTELFCTPEELREELKRAGLWFLEKGNEYISKLIKLLGDSGSSENSFVHTNTLGIRILQEITDSPHMKTKMIELGAIKMIIKLLDTSSGDVLRETLKFANILFYENTEAQTALLSYLHASKGIHGFFGSLYKRLVQFTRELKQRQFIESSGQIFSGRYDVKLTEYFFLFLQLICTGYKHKHGTPNKELQNLLRSHDENPSDSANLSILAELLTYFNVLELQLPIYSLNELNDPSLHIDQMKLLFQILLTLAESVHANEKNQVALIETNRLFRPCLNIIGISLKELLKKVTVDPKTVWNILKLKNLTLSFLLGFLEGSPSSYIISSILLNINAKVLMKPLKTCYSLIQLKKLRADLPTGAFERFLEIGKIQYVLLKRLLDNDSDNLLKKEIEKYPWYDGLNESFKQYVGSIEIVKEDKLERIYFTIPRIILDIWNKPQIQKLKDHMNYSLNRDNNYEKIEDFFDKSQDLIFELKYNWNLQYGPKKVQHRSQEIDFTEDVRPIKTEFSPLRLRSKIGTRSKVFEDSTFVLALLINFFVLIGYKELNGESKIASYYRILIWVLGSLHLLLSILRLSAYYIIKGPVKLQKLRRKRTTIKKKQRVNLEEEEDLTDASAISTLKRNNTAIREIFAVLHSKTSIYLLFYLIFSILGVAITPFAFAFHLLDCLHHFKIIRNLFEVVFYKNLRLLLETALLLLVLLYIYAVLGFWIFNRDFTGNECDNLIRCYLYQIDSGILSQSGIGPLLIPPSYSDLTHYLGRLVFDVSYYILIIVIFISIVNGIVIDSFGDIRDRHAFIMENMKSKCFICGIDHGIFERYSDGFRQHIKEDHNMWMYVFFLLYLEFKNSIKYTAQEAYMKEMTVSRDLSFFPIGRAMCFLNKKKVIAKLNN